MVDIIKNYIPWQFDRELTRNQKVKRLKQISRYIIHLFEKLCCRLIIFKQWEKIMEKYSLLLYEFRDLVFELGGDEDEEAIYVLENILMKIKKRKRYCLECIDIADEEIFCVCESCDICGRRELCFC